MIANVAFLAALTTFLAVAWLAGELSFLAPYKAGIFRHHGLTIGLAILVLFLNLCAAYYGIARGSSSATPAGSCRTWTGNWGPAMPSSETSIGT